MRNFTNISALPGHIIVIDGEAYNCPDVQVPDMIGTVRTVPADRVLAVQWYGDHRHGSIEGFGAMEGFNDKSQLAPFVFAWLRGRAKDKAEKYDAVLRTRQQVDEAITSHDSAIASMRDEIKGANGDRLVNLTRLFDNLLVERERLLKMRPTDAVIATAKSVADAAEKEAADA